MYYVIIIQKMLYNNYIVYATRYVLYVYVCMYAYVKKNIKSRTDIKYKFYTNIISMSI